MKKNPTKIPQILFNSIFTVWQQFAVYRLWMYTEVYQISANLTIRDLLSQSLNLYFWTLFLNLYEQGNFSTLQLCQAL